ncbi:pyridoxal phosphate-dependent decarboxylase family protein [Roseiterribacter gracilis]|uniref:Aspartate aminotransferase family protein n=1 Tax=Roseiterribacter gracilis TaxID=2812848 RepID=A0A8S8X826_9PROT|nr:aspartate aminotransferase family protein [Rhodospirillales bacterium TMPK1]
MSVVRRVAGDETSVEREALKRAVIHAFAHLHGLDSSGIGATKSVDDLRRALGRKLDQDGVDPAQVIDELVADVRGGLNHSQSGRFFGWVIGGGLPAAIGADWLTTVWDQNAGLYATSPAAAVVEEVAGAWLRDLFDLPAETSFAFTTGTQMAHVTCLAAARHAVLAKRGWNVELAGLCGAPPIRILANADRHNSVDRAVRMLGLGTSSIEELPVESNGRVASDTLASALSRSDVATIVVLQAGELNRAVFDTFHALAPIARAAGAWVHVDGAFGLWAKACPQTRSLVEGIELCDSWTTDAHKYLNVPYDCGIAFVRDAASHRNAMTVSASYLPADGSARDQIDWNPEFSRRARGFAVYAALRQLGRQGLSDLVARTRHHARALVEGIGALDGAEVVATSSLNQGLVRFLSPMDGAADFDHDRRTDDVIATINRDGEAFFGGVTWRGRRAMRISVSNWRTTDEDVARAIEAVRDALRKV